MAMIDQFLHSLVIQLENIISLSQMEKILFSVKLLSLIYNLQSTENVYLFIPNLIGYTRIVLAFTAFFFMQTSPGIATLLYISSYLLDEFDGVAARAFNQATCYGALLDMLTDRCLTSCLLLALAIFYPPWAILFQLLICLDITSHWMHMYSSMMRNVSSHKSIDDSADSLLKLYYRSRSVMSFICGFNELFYVMLYLMHFGSGPMVGIPLVQIGLWKLLAAIAFPVCATKNYLNVVQLVRAVEFVVKMDKKERGK